MKALLVVVGIILLLPIQSFAVENCSGYYSPGNPFSCCSDGNCTWWGYFNRPDLYPTCNSHGGTWYGDADGAGIPVGNTPAYGAIACFWGGNWPEEGHVAFVETANSDKSCYVSEMGCDSWNGVHNDTYIQQEVSGFIYGAFECSYYGQTPSGTVDLSAGDTYTFTVKFKNESKTAWYNNATNYPEHYVELKSVTSGGALSESFLYHSSWLNNQSPVSMSESVVKPNEIATFTFTGKVPSTADSGLYLVYFRPNHSHEDGQLMPGWGGMHFQVNVVEANHMPISSAWMFAEQMKAAGNCAGYFYDEGRHDNFGDLSLYAVDFNLNSDCSADAGFPVLAVANGEVTFVGSTSKYGQAVEIDHGDWNGKGVTSYYGRLNPDYVSMVAVSQEVKQGQVIGFIGHSGGFSSEDYLHFELREDGKSVQITSIDGIDLCPACDGTIITSANDSILMLEFNANGGSAKFGNKNGSVHWWYGWDESDLYASNGLPRRCYIQDYYGNEWLYCAIVYDPLGGARRAYTVRTGFWHDDGGGEGWTQLSPPGPQSNIGMPITNEYTVYGTSLVRQDFQKGYLLYDPSQSPPISAHNYQLCAPGWTNNGWNAAFSYAFAECYDKNGRVHPMGSAIEKVVEDWNSYGFHKQRFNGGSRGKGMIVYDPSDVTHGNKAFYIFGQFYTAYTQNSSIGPGTFGPPVTDKLAGIQRFKYGKYVEVNLGGGMYKIQAFDLSNNLVWESSPYATKTAGAVEATTEAALPNTFSLNQNYPNPFNPMTTVRYTIPNAMHVRLDIFNILGQNIQTLVDENQTAGEHSVLWNSEKFSSGIYFYRIRAGDAAETKKMILLK